MCKYVISLAALLVVLVNNLQASDDLINVQTLYKAICNNDKAARLTSVSQVKALVEQLRKDAANCLEGIGRTIAKLGHLVTTDEEHVCSQEKANLMRDFYFDEIIQPKLKPPAAIRNFFAAYGLKVSQVCRENMIQFYDKMHQNIMSLLTAEDKSLMQYWTGKASPLVNLAKEPKDFNNLVVPKALIRGPPKIRIDKSVLRLKIATQVREQQVRCLRRFKPLYEPIMMPLITLSSIGFNYEGQGTMEGRTMESNLFIYNWYRILYMCESLTSFAIVDDDSIPYNYDETRRLNKNVRVILGPKKEFEIKVNGVKKKFNGEEVQQDLLDSIPTSLEDLASSSSVETIARESLKTDPTSPTISSAVESTTEASEVGSKSDSAISGNMATAEDPTKAILPITFQLDDKTASLARVQDPILSLNERTLMMAIEKFKNKVKKARNECTLPNRLTRKLQSGLSSVVAGNEIKDIIKLIDLIQEREILLSDASGCHQGNLDEYLKRKHRREYMIKVGYGVGGVVAVSLIAVAVGVAIKSGIDIISHAQHAADGLSELGSTLSQTASLTDDIIQAAGQAAPAG